MDIPYGRQSISDEDIQAVASALSSDWLTMGPLVDQFETALMEKTESPFACAVSNGTAALHTAYSVLDFKPGDEIITTPLTFVATASAAIIAGANVKFGDVERETGNLDPDSVIPLISSKTRAITVVDYAGNPANLSKFRDICDKNGLYLIEDAAHSIGSTYQGTPVGSIADLTTFSFFPTKNMTTGEGGAVTGSSSKFQTLTKRFRSQGMVRNPAELRSPEEGPWHQEVHKLGLNYRLPDVLCALGINQLKRLEIFKNRRKEIFDFYSKSLQGLEGLTLPKASPGSDPMWHLYPIRVPSKFRKKFFEHMRQSGILVQVNYLPVYWHPYFEDLGYRRGASPLAEDYYKEEVSIPMHVNLQESDLARIVETIHEFFKSL